MEITVLKVVFVASEAILWGGGGGGGGVTLNYQFVSKAGFEKPYFGNQTSYR